MITKPVELENAETILQLCDRWKCPPSVILAEDMHTVMRLLTVVAEGSREPSE